MTNILLIDIILNGFFDDASLLKEYLIRNQKNAEKETFITQQEFYKRCYNVITIFENKIDDIFFKRQTDLYIIADLRESENKPFEKFIVEAEELSKKSFSLNLLTLTNGRLIGKLYFNDIQYIKNILNEINLNKLNSEIITDEKSQENKLTKPEKTIFDYISNVNNKESFAIELKNTFNIESGIDFKIMIELLKEEKIFTYTYFAPFFRSIAIYFNREIGTQNGLNDLYKHSEAEKKHYAEKIIVIQNKLNPLITKHKKNL
jgi:hypothetical protein